MKKIALEPNLSMQSNDAYLVPFSAVIVPISPKNLIVTGLSCEAC